MKWLRSWADLAVDLTVTLALEVGALIDDWRNER